MTTTTRTVLLLMGITASLLTGCDSGGSAQKIVPAVPLTGAELEAFEKLQKSIQESERQDRAAGKIQ